MDPRRFLCISAGGGEGGLFWLLWLLVWLALLELSEDIIKRKMSLRGSASGTYIKEWMQRVEWVRCVLLVE